jgi:hypothetical protein
MLSLVSSPLKEKMNSDWSASLLENPAEAARYALTRRLLPVLRHHLVVHLQPIGMIYEVLERKLSVDKPDLGAVREGLGKINNLARLAVNSSLDVVTWLAPDPSAAIGIGAGVAECLAMLSGNFRFRGFNIANEVGEAPLQVSQAALREVFTAALIAITDNAAGPVDLLIQVHLSAHRATISVQTRPGEGTGFTTEMAYRAMVWNDVRALAQGNDVELVLEGAVATLTFTASTGSRTEGVSGTIR